MKTKNIFPLMYGNMRIDKRKKHDTVYYVCEWCVDSNWQGVWHYRTLKGARAFMERTGHKPSERI